MKVLYRIVALLTTLLTIDSGTGVGIVMFQFLGQLVSALAEIQIVKGVQIQQNNLHQYTPVDVRHTT